MAERVEPGFEAVALIAAVVFVESPGLCVVVYVYPFLPGVGRCIGLAGLIVGVGCFAYTHYDPSNQFKHERALSPADLFGGKAPVGALIGLLERIR